MKKNTMNINDQIDYLMKTFKKLIGVDKSF